MAPTNNIPRIRIPSKYGTVWDSQKPYQIWYGGRGSSKSWTKAIKLLLKAQSQPYYRGIFARDTQKNVRNSQYQLFKDIAGRFNCFRNQFQFTDGPMKILCRQNGNFMTGGSFEQPDTLRSVADPTDFWAEEPITRGSQINREDFFDIVGSLRNSHGVPTQFHFTFNPISKNTWIYEDFFAEQKYDAETLFINYWDNPFCPQSTITFLESLQILDPKRYEVDARGNWGISYEGQIYPDFESYEHEAFIALHPTPDFYGVDFGFVDATAVTEGKVIDEPGFNKKALHIHEVLYQSGLTSVDLIDRLNTLGMRKDVVMVCDNARPEQIEDLKRAGYHAIACKKGVGSVQQGINYVKTYRLKFSTASKNLFDEVSTYCWDSKNGQLIDVPAKSIDHGMDSMRYGCESLRAGGSGVEEFDDWV